MIEFAMGYLIAGTVAISLASIFDPPRGKSMNEIRMNVAGLCFLGQVFVVLVAMVYLFIAWPVMVLSYLVAFLKGLRA